ncbi:MAG: hypothetical protein UR69_C0003G0020 [Candidatus Moranbacteria bacterium GW2011_GWE2_35_2-]|nr:MAG: hypothetical protein UR69_C0003G0020 [Candidatus Moranbacteria bacterium GW2011_GWE2_35_2-]
MNIIILLKHKLSIFLVSCIFIYLGSVGVSAASFPVLLFSDLTDAPVSGWEGSPTKGAAISIWGRNLGTERGSSYVTIGGVNLTNDSDYAEWGATTNPTTASGQQRITFWLNSSLFTQEILEIFILSVRQGMIQMTGLVWRVLGPLLERLVKLLLQEMLCILNLEYGQLMIMVQRGPMLCSILGQLPVFLIITTGH